MEARSLSPLQPYGIKTMIRHFNLEATGIRRKFDEIVDLFCNDFCAEHTVTEFDSCNDACQEDADTLPEFAVCNVAKMLLKDFALTVDCGWIEENGIAYIDERKSNWDAALKRLHNLDQCLGNPDPYDQWKYKKGIGTPAQLTIGSLSLFAHPKIATCLPNIETASRLFDDELLDLLEEFQDTGYRGGFLWLT